MIALKRYLAGLAVYIHISPAMSASSERVLLQQRQITDNRVLTTGYIKQMATAVER